MSTTLPNDLWDYVVQFIPALSLKDMISVNRYFFNLAMDYRYRQISFTYLNERMLWMLVRLKDPAVSYRVRTIYIYPDFLKEEVYARQPVRVRGTNSRDRSDILRYKLFLKTGKCCLPVEFLMEWMQDVLSSLPNVVNYHITWAGLPDLLENPAALLLTIFKTAPIQLLTVTISLQNIRTLDMCAFGWLHNLQELQILLQHDNGLSLTDSGTLCRLASAIKSVRKTLKSLAVESWGPIHLSELLARIDRLPHLEKLLVTLPVNDVQLGDPSCLSAFLDLHCDSLRVLALRAEEHVEAGPSKVPSEPFFLDHWLQEALQGVVLSKVQSLEINACRILPETCIACIQTFAPSLTSLSLTGQHQSVQFIDQVISTFSERDEQGLEYLRLGSVTLNPRLVDLLAEKLPGLQRLTLQVKDLKPSSPPSPPDTFQSLSRYELRQERLETFFSEMETRRYPDWHLRHVELVLSMEDAEFWQTHVEALLAECVPSIRSFG
ncbi:hypothetical protein JOM56_007832 [Amanita muscaria]